MKVGRALAIIYSVLISINAFCATSIDVKSQNDFDNLEETIKKALKGGSLDIEVRIGDGVFLFSSYHLDLSNLNYPNASILIKGNGAKIISSSDARHRKFAANEYNITFLNESLSDISCWSETIQLDENVEVVDPDNKLCRIRMQNETSFTTSPKFVNITKWYLNGIYKVQSLKDGYVYFVADDLKQGYNTLLSKYDINNDYSYGHKHPRCQLYYGEPASYRYKCVNSQFLTMGYSKLKSLTISGLEFVGNAGNGSLMVVNDCKLQFLRIENCSFRNIQDVIFYSIMTDNVIFTDNEVADCNGPVLISENSSKNTRFTNNRVTNIGLRLNNVKAVQCVSENFLISNNLICNFSYAAIGSGLNKNAKSSSICSGVIEGNEIFMDKDYYEDASKHTLMDSGAIYIGTITHGVIIRNNYIHNISGTKDNRGIFCDDGTKNVTITDNLVQQVKNSYCIDLRNVTNVADMVPDHNTGNICTSNLTDGDIRFYIKNGTCKVRNNKRIGDRRYTALRAYKNWKR